MCQLSLSQYPISIVFHLPADKTGGKKFSKEFEEASSKLEEFVNGLDKQVKNGPSLTEALENAGIFYEAQYKEVKVVANVSVPFLDPPQLEQHLPVFTGLENASSLFSQIIKFVGLM